MTDTLRAELERLFELDELVDLTRNVLGFDPDELGGTASKATFARALVDHCAVEQAIPALADVVVSLRADVTPQVAALRGGQPPRPLPEPNDMLDELKLGRITEQLRHAATFAARREAKALVVHVIREEFLRDSAAVRRFVVANRLLRDFAVPGVPEGLEVGEADGRVYVAHEPPVGQNLAQRLERTGPMHINEARPLLVSILESLAAMHERRLTHGNLEAANISVERRGAEQVATLLHPAVDRLRGRPTDDQSLFVCLASPDTMAPELIAGRLSDARSDLYSFGCVVYQLLTGKKPFPGRTAAERAAGHLSGVPARPSAAAPRGWVPAEVDELVLRLLAKDPAERPGSARALLEELAHAGVPLSAREQITEEKLVALIDALVASPSDTEAALALEGSVDAGAEASRVAEAFALAAGEVDAASADAGAVRRNLRLRAARLLERAKDLPGAEAHFRAVLEADPTDRTAVAGLEDILRRQKKFEELVEVLLGRAETADTRRQRAQAFADIGRVYVEELKDQDQAIVAYTQAWCENVEDERVADELERLAGDRQPAWEEILSAAMAAELSDEFPADSRTKLLLKSAEWFQEKVKRPDLALPAYQKVVAADPANDEALEGMARNLRKAQQWNELGAVLMQRADAAATPTQSRDLRYEAAALLEHQLDNAGGARAIYEQILGEDPGHKGASEALARICEKEGDAEGLVKVLERRASALRGEPKLDTMCRIAEVFEEQLSNDAEATRRYRQVLELDGGSLRALQGLDRLYAKTGRYKELLEIIDGQIAAAATPRQKIGLLRRKAAIHEEEFLDHEGAVAAWNAVIELDPGHEEAITALVRHLRVLKRWEDVVALYDRLFELITDSDRRFELAMAQGHVLVEQVGSPERAMVAFERAVEERPTDPKALEALAHLRETSGDAEKALEAIEELARQADSAAGRAEHYLRAARLLEDRGDRDGAIAFYKKALDATPDDLNIANALLGAYEARGDIHTAIQLLEQRIARTKGDSAVAALHARIASLALARLMDDERADKAAREAFRLDPANEEALFVLGEVAFGAERFVEAARYYEPLAASADRLPRERAVRLLTRFVDALSKTGSTEKALGPMDTLLRIAPDDADALRRVARVTGEHGSSKRAVELFRKLAERFPARFEADAESRLAFGKALVSAGEPEAAIAELEAAADLMDTSPEPLQALVDALAAQERWDDVIKTRLRQLDLLEGPARGDVLLAIGDVYFEKLKDATRAAKNYVAALEERPEDRRVLSKLMQLYSAGQDWEKLVDVVVKLSDFVDDEAQRAKYLQTAAMLCRKQLGDHERAEEYIRRVLAIDPDNAQARDELIAVERALGHHEAVAELLERRLEAIRERGDAAAQLKALDELAELYDARLGWIEKAVEALEAALALGPEDRERLARLATLYARSPERYQDKAIELQTQLLRENAYRPEPYKALRKLYTELKQPDGAWCLSQALAVLKLAEPDEERFYNRLRSETPAGPRVPLADDDWRAHVLDSVADPLLTNTFLLVEPAILATRTEPAASRGYTDAQVLGIDDSPYPMVQTLGYACAVLGITPPTLYANTADPTGLSFLNTPEPSVVLGNAALSVQIPPQPAAFIAARHMAFYRHGVFMRHLLSTGTMLKAWLFGAIKLSAPQFPVTADIQGPVEEAMTAIKSVLSAGAREQLASTVARLLGSGGSLDLKRWVAGVDLAADRLGLVVCHDLHTALGIIRASDAQASSVPVSERERQLVLFAVSRSYLALRRNLGIAVDS